MIGPTLWKIRGRDARGARRPVPAATLAVCLLGAGLLVFTRGQTTAASSERRTAASPASLAAPAGSTPRLVTQARPAMGTTFTLRLYVNDQAQGHDAAEAAFEEIERVEEALSHYRPTSEISRINRLAATPPGIVTDAETFALLARAQAFSRQSDGAFDITVGPLMQAWGFFRGRGHYPSAAELATAQASTGWRHVTLDDTRRSLRTDRAGMSLDLGGIGKGYALDRAAAVLRAAGVTSALLDAGSSSLYAIGAPPDTDGWLIQIPDDTDATRTIAHVRLRDASLSTSGTQQQFFTMNGRRYSHIIDPRTGHPVEGMSQVTLLAPNATDSDALTKVAFVMGPERAPNVLAHTPGTAALFIRDTSASSKRIVQWRWPNDSASSDTAGLSRYERPQASRESGEPPSIATATAPLDRRKRPNGPRPKPRLASRVSRASRAHARIASGTRPPEQAARAASRPRSRRPTTLENNASGPTGRARSPLSPAARMRESSAATWPPPRGSALLEFQLRASLDPGVPSGAKTSSNA